MHSLVWMYLPVCMSVSSYVFLLATLSVCLLVCWLSFIDSMADCAQWPQVSRRIIRNEFIRDLTINPICITNLCGVIQLETTSDCSQFHIRFYYFHFTLHM